MDRWELALSPLVGSPVNKYEHLMKRMEMEAVEKMIEAGRAGDVSESETAPAASAETEDTGDALAKEPIAAECTIEDFTKVDLRVARIIAAEEVPGAKKLLGLTVSLGGGTTRKVFAGIKAHYDPKSLIGRLVIICANLKPRQMKFGLSEGMILAAGDGDSSFVLSPDTGAKPGMRVH
jgi:methionyl-tRNA synthetase